MSPSTAALSGGTVSTPYSVTFSATGGSASYTYAISGTVPTGLVFSGSSLSGTPTLSGTFNFRITATDNSAAPGPYSGFRDYSITIAPPTITVSPATLPAATVGTAYNQTITASGGTAPYTFSLTSGTLPAGLSLSSSGTLSGTPTAGGNFTFSIRATDSSTGTGPYNGTRIYSMTVNSANISLPATTLASGTVGTAYSQTISSASGGTAPYTYSLSGSLPAGLTLSTSGTISGTPTALGTFNFGIIATDSSTGTGPYFSASRSFSLTIASPVITVSPATITDATVGTAYSQAITASGGTAPYTFSLSSGILPAGLTLSSSGTLSGTPTAGGSFTFTLTATDSSTGAGPYTGTIGYSVTVNPATIMFPATTLTGGTEGASYSQTISQASGGTAPYTYSLSGGSLPSGLTLNTSGTISGTPTAHGTFNFGIIATDSSTGSGPYFSAPRNFSLTIASPVIVVSPAVIPDGTVGTSYSQNISASGGTAPYAFLLTSGTLPAGLTLSSSGTLSGTPTVGGSFTFSIQATDSSTGTGPYTGTRSYTMTTEAVLPVSLISYTAKADGNSARLNWSTASEQNNKSFTVFRSVDGKTFTELGTISGHGTTNSMNEYVFYDRSPISGANYYKLVQTDNNGKTTELGIQSVNFKLSILNSVSIYPNPATNLITLNYSTSFTKLELVNILGNVVKKLSLNADQRETKLDLTDLSSGNYLIRLSNSSEMIVKKVIKL